MNSFHLAIIIIGPHRESTSDINEWIEQFDYRPLVQTGNLHAFLIFGDSSTEEMEALARINLDPADELHLLEHGDPWSLGHALEEVLNWTKQRQPS